MINKALSIIRDSSIIAYDTETNSLNVRLGKITDIGISNELGEAISIPIRIWNGDSLIETEYFKDCSIILKALLNKKLIGHNFYFDGEITKNDLGIDLWNALYLDTIMLIHTISENSRFGLKDHCKNLFGLDSTKEQEEVKESIKANGGSAHDYYKADPSIRGKYNEQDCKLTMRVMQHYLPILKKEGLEKFFFEDEVMPLYSKVTRVMQSRGIQLDLPLLKATKADIELDINILEGMIQHEISMGQCMELYEF